MSAPGGASGLLLLTISRASLLAPPALRSYGRGSSPSPRPFALPHSDALSPLLPARLFGVCPGRLRASRVGLAPAYYGGGFSGRDGCAVDTVVGRLWGAHTFGAPGRLGANFRRAPLIALSGGPTP